MKKARQGHSPVTQVAVNSTGTANDPGTSWQSHTQNGFWGISSVVRNTGQRRALFTAVAGAQSIFVSHLLMDSHSTQRPPEAVRSPVDKLGPEAAVLSCWGWKGPMHSTPLSGLTSGPTERWWPEESMSPLALMGVTLEQVAGLMVTPELGGCPCGPGCRQCWALQRGPSPSWHGAESKTCSLQAGWLLREAETAMSLTCLISSPKLSHKHVAQAQT